MSGCYQKNITYINGLTQEEVSMYQIVSLIELAAYCEQEIHYDCTLAPLTAEEVDYAFWEDRQGETNVYYTGKFVMASLGFTISILTRKQLWNPCL